MSYLDLAPAPAGGAAPRQGTRDERDPLHAFRGRFGGVSCTESTGGSEIGREPPNKTCLLCHEAVRVSRPAHRARSAKGRPR
jgi:hypothetical protein